jgi:zinc transport system ATP-binding protein
MVPLSGIECMTHTLEVFLNNKLIFFSDKHWLYPLFDLEQFINESEYNPTDLMVHDKIIGKAAAMLVIHLGIGHVKGELMSELGKEVLDRYGVKNNYDKLVDRIICATEDILKDEFDHINAYDILRKRAGL